MRGFGKRPTGRASVRNVGVAHGTARKARKSKLHMIRHTKPAEFLQGPITLIPGILLSSPPAPFVLLTNQPDKQRLFQSILQPTRVSQKPRRFVSPVTFSEQVLAFLRESPDLADTPAPVPSRVWEKVIPRLRCLQQVIERLPKHFCPYRAMPEYKLTSQSAAIVLSVVKLQETGAPVVSVAGGSVRGNAKSVPLPPFPSSEKKPVQSATESGVITDDVYLAKR